MSWGGLNPALTAWRDGVNLRFPSRGTGSDGGYADRLHGSNSQHQPDGDGSVDAFDMDCNLLGSDQPAGTALERRLIEALKLDFEADRRSQLWIHQREISNEDVRDWAERRYGGPNAHDKHVHWESDPAFERDGSPWKFTRTDALLRELNGDEMRLDDNLFDGEPSSSWKARYPGQKASVRNALAFAAYDSHDAEKTAATLAGGLSALAKAVAAIAVQVGQVDEQVLAAIGNEASPQEQADLIRALLGSERAAVVGALLHP